MDLNANRVYNTIERKSMIWGSRPVQMLVNPRLAIWLVLNCREDPFFCVFGTCCSSWVHINSGTSKRSWLLPEGQGSLAYIQASNMMVSRTFSCMLMKLQDCKQQAQHLIVKSMVCVFWNLKQNNIHL